MRLRRWIVLDGHYRVAMVGTTKATAGRQVSSSELSVTWSQALAWRMQRHLLEPVGTSSVHGVVRRLGAVPSMDESLAELAVRTRQESSQPGQLAQAYAAGTIIKAFAFRGAMHYLSPEDGGAYLALRAAGRQWERASWVDYYGLTPQAWPDFRAAVRAALDDGPLTVRELGRVLARHRAYRHLEPVFDDGAGTLVKPLTWQGDVSLAPARDGQLTLQRLDDNPHWRGIPDLDDAGSFAVREYLRTYGPATPDHVHHWLGSGLSAGRKRLDHWLAELADQLARVDVEGTPALVLRTDVDDLLAAEPSDAVRLLPGHDQWVAGPGTKDEHVTPPALRDLMTRKANPVIRDGMVCGTWASKGEALEVRWLDDSPPPAAALTREGARLAGILGRELTLVVR